MAAAWAEDLLHEGRRVAAIAVGLFVATARADVTSTFTASPDGWSLIDLVTHPTGASPASGATYAITYKTTGGNPDGYISGKDGSSQTLYFVAPAAYHGNQSGAIGRTFSFDFFDSLSTAALGTLDAPVILTNRDRTKSLYQTTITSPLATFSKISYTLAAGNGWKVNGFAGATATADDFSDVLGDLGAVYILADYRPGMRRPAWTMSGSKPLNPRRNPRRSCSLALQVRSA